MNVSEITDHLLKNELKNNISFFKIINADPGQFEDIPDNINPELKSALIKSGIEKLFSHQAEAIKNITNDKNTIVVTPTASGKTLCYNIPVINSILSNPETKAIYLFPTKALSQDQTEELYQISNYLNKKINTFTYDGDTPVSLRQSIKEKGQIIVTNPDMLHAGILPNHPKWVKIFENLKYIVIDEVHTYRGIFGSHLANLILRLKRISNFYGSNPQYICCSATIANPKELAENLIGEEVTLVNKNGAPRGRKFFILYNPPVVDPDQGIRRGVVLESKNIARYFIEKNFQTIIFSRSRLRTELIASYLKKTLPEKKDKISSYRGGFLPNERRKIEKGIRDGEIIGIVSTNALELGIDIGSLDVCVIAGYPGSIASTWQQAGRSGRKTKDSVAFLLASNSPIDQFYINNPDYFFSTPPENGYINPQNPFILIDHIKCAAFELPFLENEKFGDNDIQSILKYLEEKGIIHFVKDKYHWMSESYPAEKVSLRSADTGNFAIVDITDNRNEVIGEVDRASAPVILYKEAIYIHGSNQYQIEKLDYENRKALARIANVNYFTDALTKTDLKILSDIRATETDNYEKSLSEVLIRTVATKFKKLKFGTHENIGWGDIDLPPEEMHTIALGISIERHLLEIDGEKELRILLQSIGYVLHNLIPVNLLCDIRDIRRTEQLKSVYNEKPTIYIYDSYPGGIGLAQKLYNIIDVLISESEKLVKKCSCSSGCPSCTGVIEKEWDLNINLKSKVLKCLKALT